MSNQPKICPTCHTSNPGSAQFCAACGSALPSTLLVNPMLQYKQLRLQPTSLYGWQSLSKWPFYCFIFTTSIIFLWGIGWAIGTLFEPYWHIIPEVTLVWCIILAFFIWQSYCSYKYTFKKSDKSLSSLADYIQEYKYGGSKQHPKYVFFVKDNKFGVMNVTEFKVAIPAQYDEIAWREPNRILTVTKGNETYDIDIFGNQLR